VVVEIFIKKVDPKTASFDLKEKSVSVLVKLSECEEYQLELDLFAAVIPENTKKEVLSTKIVLNLEKAVPASWPTLEKSDVEVANSFDEVIDDPKPKPFHKKNWDQILSDEPEEKLEGDAALQKVFQDIFKNGSEEQKKAMVKSFTESAGTVLSTNWEVCLIFIFEMKVKKRKKREKKRKEKELF